MRLAGRKCQYCGRSKRQGIKLQIHHLNYDSLYNERMSDLAIVCEDCHKKADEVYRMEKARATFMSKKYGDDWQDRFTTQEATRQFQRWLASKE